MVLVLPSLVNSLQGMEKLPWKITPKKDDLSILNEDLYWAYSTEPKPALSSPCSPLWQVSFYSYRHFHYSTSTTFHFPW